MALTGVFTTDDLEQLGARFTELKPSTALDLIAVVDEGRLADPDDAPDVLMLAAEVLVAHDRLNEAEAVGARVSGLTSAATYHRAHHAELLLKLGREQDALPIFESLRPLMLSEPLAAQILGESLEEGGQADLAIAWLTAAADTLNARARAELMAGREPEESGTALLVDIVRVRHRLRADHGYQHDELDELADDFNAAAVDEVPVVMFWPEAEFARLLVEFPAMQSSLEDSWDEHRRAIESVLVSYSQDGVTGLELSPGSVDAFIAYVRDAGADASDPETLDDFAEDHALAAALSWPPERNAECWCGSGLKYKKCCLPRSRPVG